MKEKKEIYNIIHFRCNRSGSGKLLIDADYPPEWQRAEDKSTIFSFFPQNRKYFAINVNVLLCNWSLPRLSNQTKRLFHNRNGGCPEITRNDSSLTNRDSSARLHIETFGLQNPAGIETYWKLLGIRAGNGHHSFLIDFWAVMDMHVMTS